MDKELALLPTILQKLTNIFRQIDISVNIIIYPYFNMSDTDSDAENIQIEETNEVVEPEHDPVKPKQGKKVKIDRKLLEPDEVDEAQDKSIEKPKKPRTPAQIAAFEKATKTRKENAAMRERLRTLEKANKAPTQSQKKQIAKSKVDEIKAKLEKYDSDSDSSSSSEEIVVKKKKSKPKKVIKKKKKVVLYVSSSDSESDSEEEQELYPQPKKRVKRSEPIQQQEQTRDIRNMFI